MKKSYWMILACFISVFLFQAFTTPTDPHYTNLQILPKDISNHDLDSVMHHFTASLGVKCNYCHVKNEEEHKMNFASDDKPEKKIARKMMLMAIDINKNYFKMDRDDMDHDHDMNKDMDHAHAMNNDKEHDHDMNKGMNHDMHDMDTSNMVASSYMLRSVTCYTCHKGEEHPEKNPPLHQDGPPPPPPGLPKPADSK